MVSTREIIAITRYPSKKGYVAEIWLRIKQGDKARIAVDRIIEPYDQPLEKLDPKTVRRVKEKALKRLEKKLKELGLR